MEDRIDIRGLSVRTIIGVNEWERTERQEVIVDLSLFADLRRAGKSDDLQDTVNYRSIAKAVIEHVESARRFTVEALAEDVAALCLREAGVRRVRVRLEKPGAIRFARSVGVEIEREAPDRA
jgi:FolB domain-containing protein